MPLPAFIRVQHDSGLVQQRLRRLVPAQLRFQQTAFPIAEFNHNRYPTSHPARICLSSMMELWKKKMRTSDMEAITYIENQSESYQGIGVAFRDTSPGRRRTSASTVSTTFLEISASNAVCRFLIGCTN